MAEELGDNPRMGVLARLICAGTMSIVRRPVGALLLACLVASLAIAVAFRFLELKTDRSDLIDPQAHFQQRWLNYVDRFGNESDIVVVFESENIDRLKGSMDLLGKQLQAEPNLFKAALWRFDPRTLSSKGLQYLTPLELEKGLERLETYRPILQGHWNRAGLESYCRRLRDHAEWARRNDDQTTFRLTSEQAILLADSLTEFAESYPLASVSPNSPNQSTEQQREPSFAPSGRISPWPDIFPGAREHARALSQVRYQLNDEESMGFLTVMPVESGTGMQKHSQAIDRLRELIHDLQQHVPDVTISLTGIPVLESDEMDRSQSDMTRASIVSFCGVGLILLIGFRGMRHPLMALMMLVIGLCWSLGYATLAVGHLNILSVSFAAILIGLGIDFGIHYLARYLELRHAGEELESALVKTSAGVGTGIITAAVTTALAFLCATFTDFLGVAELGMIAGGGILLCGIATFVILPALVALADRNIEPRKLPTPFQGSCLRRMTRRWPKGVTLGCAALIAVVGLGGLDVQQGHLTWGVHYDSNLLNLQPEGVDSVDVQQRIFDKSQGSLLYAVSLADNPWETRRLARQFEELPTVSHVEHLGHWMPRYPIEETELLIRAIRAHLINRAAVPRELPQIDPLTIGHALEDLLAVVQANRSAEAERAAKRLDLFLDRLERLPLEPQLELLTAFQHFMLSALQQQFESIAKASDPKGIDLSDLDPALRMRFVSDEGDWLLRIHPREQIWDKAPLEQFVSDIRSVDPDVTGTPLQNYEASKQICDSFLDAALYALAIIVLVLLIDSLESGPLWVSLLSPLVVVAFALVTVRHPEHAIDPLWLFGLYVGIASAVAAIFDYPNVRNTWLTLLPPLGGGCMMFGLMGFLEIDLNPANLIVLPLILGIGVDDGVHVLHDFRMQRGRYRMSASTINAVVLTSLTSMTGFGSMLLASHRGLASLGMVLVIGVGSCLFISLVALPAILSWISARAPERTRRHGAVESLEQKSGELWTSSAEQRWSASGAHELPSKSRSGRHPEAPTRLTVVLPGESIGSSEDSRLSEKISDILPFPDVKEQRDSPAPLRRRTGS